MSEDVIEQCESDLLDAQEAWILQLCRLGHMYVCMYVCMQVCLHMYAFTHECGNACMQVRMYQACMHVGVCVHVHMYVHV